MKIEELVGKEVILTKEKDSKFKGNHPKGINEGYITRGILKYIYPCVYVESRDNWFHTSMVKEIIDNKIYTLNSVYTIKPVK